MSRPKPKVLRAIYDAKARKNVEILEAPRFYVITYDDQPFNLRVAYDAAPGLHKYPRMSFANAAHARLLVTKLNRLFNTNLFRLAKFVPETVK